MSTLSTTVRRGLVVTAAAVAAGPIVGGVASAATDPTTTAPLDTAGIPTSDATLSGADLVPVARMAPTSALGGLPVAGPLAQNLPVAGLTQKLPLAGPALATLTGDVMPMNGMLGDMSQGLTGTAPQTSISTSPGVAAGPAALHPTTPARPATRSRTAVAGSTGPATTAHPGITSTSIPGSTAGAQMLAGIPMTGTQLGPDAPSISSLPQYAGAQKIAEMAPTLEQAKIAEAQKPPTLPVIGELPKNGLPMVGDMPVVGQLPVTGLARSLPGVNEVGSVAGLLNKF